MPKLAIALWCVFLAVSLGARIAIQLRTTGSSGFVLHRSQSGPLQLFASALFVSSLLTLLINPILALALSERSFFVPSAPPSWLLVLGGSCYVAGVSSAFLSQLTLGRSWRVGVDASERTELVTRGAYSLVRNPIFSALFLTSTGLALLCSTPLAWVACAVQLVALELQVRGVEEPYLARTHGGAYLEYAARVGRFVPGLGLLKRPS